MKFFLLIFLLAGCETYEAEVSRPVEKGVLAFEKVDIENVDHAYSIIKDNQTNNKTTAQKGIDRAIEWKPLFAKLIGVYNFGYSLNESDLKPFMDEMQDVSAIFVSKESKQFVESGAENSQALDALKKEADKGEVNNEVDALKDKKIEELEKIIHSGVSEKCNAIAEKFFYLGGGLIILSLFSSYLPFPAEGVKKAGYGTLLVGFILLLIGTTIDFLRDFLEEYGDITILIILACFLIPYFLVKFFKTKEKIEDIIEED